MFKVALGFNEPVHLCFEILILQSHEFTLSYEDICQIQVLGSDKSAHCSATKYHTLDE